MNATSSTCVTRVSRATHPCQTSNLSNKHISRTKEANVAGGDGAPANMELFQVATTLQAAVQLQQTLSGSLGCLRQGIEENSGD